MEIRRSARLPKPPGMCTITAAIAAALLPLCVGAAEPSVSCDDQAVFRRAAVNVFNNVWGTSEKGDPVKGYRQCISVDGDTIKWEWSNFQRGKGRVKSYPHVTVGWDWDGQYSAGSPLPMLATASGKLAADFAVTSRGSGTHNLALDIWMSREQHPKEPRTQLTHEVMIWLDKHEWDIPRKRQDTVTIDGRKFDLYVDETSYGKWKVVSFVAKQPMLRGSISLGPFFELMLRRSLLRGDEIINGISFGNEIGFGEGATTLHKFEITNGR
ncbi:hypothetical protein WG902_12100 [Ramlibacter sp. PS3R-8]|uniref:GH12 family glycosyl hydrolase domain-containing protein n=1 Tax=Ramlibacter sp. PS3R-8 TaxID=3133437 RepID=UPI0030B58315